MREDVGLGLCDGIGSEVKLKRSPERRTDGPEQLPLFAERKR